MNHFEYKAGELFCEDVPLADIAKSVGTPVYVYSAATLTCHFKAFANAAKNLDHLIAYSVKANSNLAVLKLLAKLGAGADVVSGGELERALRAGIKPEKIVFSGVGKTKDEMGAALRAGICQFNIESRPELIALSEVAIAMGKTAPIALRINPDVAAGGHEKITTGKAENKFGVDIRIAADVYNLARDLPGIDVVGVDMHIGSQISELAPFEKAIDKILTLVEHLREQGHNIRTFDMGGGLGIRYNEATDNPPLPVAYGHMVEEKCAGKNLKIIFEPGRAIAGNAGVLLAKIQYIKTGGARNFLILDAAMNDLIRPALYGANHAVLPVKKNEKNTLIYDVVGPVCETGDTFAAQCELPEFAQEDFVVLCSAGAYGAVQSGTYNTRPLVPEVLVAGDKFAVVRKRPDIEELLRLESVPDWI